MIRLNYLTFYFIIAAAPLSGGTVVDVKDGGNMATITEVTYNVGGNSLTQENQASGSNQVSGAVETTNISIEEGGNSKDLTFYNLGNAKIVNNNFSNPAGVGVYNTTSGSTVVTIENDGMAAYEAAVIESATNRNLMNYLFYDGTSGLPDDGVADFDILFRNSWTADDYLVVAERNGNTYFELTPLDVNGDVIADANVLKFDSAYNWRSGYENEFDENDGQDMWFTATSIKTFYQETSITFSEIYGFRVNNDGDADVKFFGASDDTFENNPKNPNVIPEPSQFGVVASLLAISLVAGRRRSRKGVRN